MRYEFDELKSVFYNYEVGYLEGQNKPLDS